MGNTEKAIERIRKAVAEYGGNARVGRIPDEDLPGRRAGVEAEEERRMTKEEQDLKRIREAGVEAYKIPDERLPRGGRTRMTFFGEAKKRVPGVGERIEVRVGDGSWRGGYRAVSGPTTDGEHPGEAVVWISSEDEWAAAEAEDRAPAGVPWPLEQIAVVEG